MLFNFELLPLECVAPWGEPGTQSLHWLGLTDGRYWIEVGEQTLLEYKVGTASEPQSPNYFEYQVARLSDDLMHMLPYVMRPVPADLIRYVAGESGRSWQTIADKWFESSVATQEADHLWDLAETEHAWRLHRMLTTIPSIDIRICSDAESVFISWDTDNEACLARGASTWSATTGTYQLPRDDFIAELRLFHSKLVDQMDQRVDQVIGGALPSGVEVDFDLLRRTQASERERFKAALTQSPPSQDWDSVRKAIAAVEQWGRLQSNGPLATANQLKRPSQTER